MVRYRFLGEGRSYPPRVYQAEGYVCTLHGIDEIDGARKGSKEIVRDFLKTASPKCCAFIKTGDDWIRNLL